ncbi:hypothetical protein [Paenibacillus sp. Soil522]|uniref:hypothetical protein n=1 Tax=Paenibacillus sp. Soil522 TaxID=1736388 RepID=UPI0006FBF10F|nr:hypothetical protein [Paenibacillus sp. Soil522]KRE30032.1 hypothetical protein ASG81_25410 [Paenibacillus sp. Soil522]
MKKKFAALMVSLMMFAGVGSAYASDVPPAPPVNESMMDGEETAFHTQKLDVLKEFQDELHKINALRVERLGLKTQIVQKQDQILDLTIEARENGDKEALKQAAEVRKQLHKVNAELKVLWKKVAAEKKAFEKAVKDGSDERAQKHIDNTIVLFGKINGKLGQKIGLLDQMIAVLS